MGQQIISEESVRERECIHRRQGVEGAFYRGDSYISALQGLRSEAATAMARKVEAFFWSDAPNIRVWLCHECAREVKLYKQA